MKNILTGVRMVVCALSLSVAAYAGSTTFLFQHDTGYHEQTLAVDSGDTIGGTWSVYNSWGSAYLWFSNPMWGNGVVLATAQTDGVATGTYYMGTIPGGDDIYIQII